MDAFFDPKNIKYISTRVSDIKTHQDILEYLKMEFHEMILYASREVVLSVKNFIESPQREYFLTVIITMRQDLANKKSDLSLN